MQGHKYAISRYKSGSHLMAYVNANTHKLKINEETDFLLVVNLDVARKALAVNTAQFFMLEKLTTKPFVDNGEFSMIGECTTPWPCFVIASTNQFIDQHQDVLHRILSMVNLSCLMLKNNSQTPALIAARYGIQEADAMLWFNELEYANHPEMNELEWTHILGKLKQFNIIDSIPELTEICYAPNIELVG